MPGNIFIKSARKMNELEEIERKEKEGFEKAKAEGNAWLMNYYGSSLQHIWETKRKYKEMSDQRMRGYEEIRKNAEAYAEQQYLEAKIKCCIEESDRKAGFAWLAGTFIFLLALAYFLLILILYQWTSNG